MKKVVTDDLIPSMHLAGLNMIASLNKDSNYIPFFNLEVDREYKGEWKFTHTSHNIGRWWDCMLRLEEATGFEIPADIEGAMLVNLYRYFDNEACMCMEPEGLESDVKDMLVEHSMRENLLTFYMLIRRRNNCWAKTTAHRMLEGIEHTINESEDNLLASLNYARLLEALVPYYELTGDELAYRLAERLANWHYEHTTLPDGSFPGWPRHSHSYLGTLKGLFLFGKMTGQHKYIDRVYKTYLATVRQIVKESGWAAHDIKIVNTTRAETTCPGDAAQLALWLAMEGYSEKCCSISQDCMVTLLDDAERMVRARILPSQILESPEITPIGEGKDRFANLTERMIGAYGGVLTETHSGKFPYTDVTAADIHSLADIYNNIIVETDTAVRVLFHFNRKVHGVQVVSKRENGKAVVTVVSTADKHLDIRIPGWASEETLTVAVNGKAVSPNVQDGFMRIPSVGGTIQVVISYVLPVRIITETVKNVEYRIQFEGDEITGISPNTDFYPFYPDLDVRVNKSGGNT